MRKIIVCGFLTVLATGVLSASAILGVCGTGFTDGTCSTQAGLGSIDGNWSLSSSAESIIGTDAFVTDTSQFPFPIWLPDTSTGQWIGPQDRGVEANDAPGLYTYTESFDLTGFNLTTVILSGQFAVDNSAELFLNGVDTGIGASSFTTLASISLTSGFNQGLNVLTFVVTNGPGPTGNPTGLFVELSGTGTQGVTTPEPASFAFMGLGLAALGILGRRLRS
jgi:hypothetical protein